MTKCNFAGDGKTGASWTDNIMAQKSAEGATEEIRMQGDGAGDDEWVGQEMCSWTWRWDGSSPGRSSVRTGRGWVTAAYILLLPPPTPALAELMEFPKSVSASGKFLSRREG